jgi:hypothetical protein
MREFEMPEYCVATVRMRELHAACTRGHLVLASLSLLCQTYLLQKAAT